MPFKPESGQALLIGEAQTRTPQASTKTTPTPTETATATSTTSPALAIPIASAREPASELRASCTAFTARSPRTAALPSARLRPRPVATEATRARFTKRPAKGAAAVEPTRLLRLSLGGTAWRESLLGITEVAAGALASAVAVCSARFRASSASIMYRSTRRMRSSVKCVAPPAASLIRRDAPAAAVCQMADLGLSSEAAGQGLEPQLPDPESGVLPLDDPATGRRAV
jgi:hypothetical protein